MKIVKKILLWLVVSFFAVMALGTLPNIAGFLSLLMVAMLLPIDKWQELLKKLIKGKLKVILCIVLAVITFFSFALIDTDVPVDNNIDSAPSVSTSSTISKETVTTKTTKKSKPVVATESSQIVTTSTTTTTKKPTTTTTIKITTTTTTTKAPTTTTTTTKKITTTTTTKKITTSTTIHTITKAKMVWIPTNGGKKYHSKSTCSKMKDPNYVTIAEAEDLGFTPCGRCYK